MILLPTRLEERFIKDGTWRDFFRKYKHRMRPAIVDNVLKYGFIRHITTAAFINSGIPVRFSVSRSNRAWFKSRRCKIQRISRSFKMPHPTLIARSKQTLLTSGSRSPSSALPGILSFMCSGAIPSLISLSRGITDQAKPSRCVVRCRSPCCGDVGAGG